MATRSMLLAGVVATVALAGCAIQTPEIGPSPSGEPLRAHLFLEGGFTGGLMFDTNRPAYVAIFQLIPGRGTALVYPRPGYASQGGASFAGLHQIPLRNLRGDYYSFLPAPIGYAGPQFFFLIASEEPLRLDPFGPVGNGLLSVLGVHFASMNAYSTMERLAMAAVPNLESQNWTTDFYVDWPQAIYSTQRRNTVLVTCGGISVYVPLDRLIEVQQALCPRTDESVDTPNEPTDTAQTVSPIRRPPPKPVTDRIASSQLERPEEYELRRRAAESGRILDANDLDDRDAPGIRDRDRAFDESIRRNPAIGDGSRGASSDGDRSRSGSSRSSGASVDRDSGPSSGSSGGGVSSPPSAPADRRPAAPRDNPPL